ncbi:allantoinase AllB [Bacillus sp. AK128]
MNKEKLVRNGLVFSEGRFMNVTIHIKNGRILSLYEKYKEPSLDSSVEVIDATGCIVVPGFIDSHVHFNDPGRTDWEGIETGSRAAAVGGTTTIFDMPLNCSPSIISMDTLARKREYLKSKSFIDYRLWGGITDTSLIEGELFDMSREIVAWKLFMSSSGINDFEYVRKGRLPIAMKLAKEHNKILALHAEWQEEINLLTNLYKGSAINERRAYLASRPVSSEEKAVRYSLELAQIYGTSVHFVHISSAKVIKLIQEGKEAGIDVTVETCPHYLVFDEEDFVREGALLKCAPPLRRREEVEELWECIDNGWIDTIGSDHSPCLFSMKQTDSIWDAWGGIQGVQFTWLAFLDEAIKRNVSLESTLSLGTANVAHRFAIDDRKGSISPGLDADLVFISLDEETHANKESFQFRNKFSPYENMTFQLKIKKTFLRGEVIYDDQLGVVNEPLGIYI